MVPFGAPRYSVECLIMKKTCAGFLSLCLSLFAALTPAAQAAQFSAESSPIRAIALPAGSLAPSLPSIPD